MDITLALVLVVAELAVLTGGYLDAQASMRPGRGARVARAAGPLLAVGAAVALVPDPVWKVAVALVTPAVVKAADQGVRRLGAPVPGGGVEGRGVGRG
ncbi:hypothetical protein SAMN04487981_10611 [Streptomyces sp. cf386]|uniref:hypothetical protein n=1 Tax=Streptomyces sp. cf386 TaxID=1761904 RepID=UPI0008916CD8|nr:hypothetical protein [Streptomyces sp. cf386]SDN63578.1 hypothetical protein SAMN04487981_10611 [Streptomyces sp. cf386]